jgi:hypothetical protein
MTGEAAVKTAAAALARSYAGPSQAGPQAHLGLRQILDQPCNLTLEMQKSMVS